MPAVKKIPYYTMNRSFFGKKTWKEYSGLVGAVQINTSQKLSYDRPAPGAISRARPIKVINEQSKAQQAKEALEKESEKLREKQQLQKPKQAEAKKHELPKSKFIEAEEKEKLPVFDLQDIPDAMDKMGWPVSAKFARKWFSSAEHIYNDQPDSVQPIDDTTLTLDWTFKFGSVKNKFNDLIEQRIYSEKAVTQARRKLIEVVRKKFISSSSTDLSIDTAALINDIRQFHIDWQIQFQPISSSNTLEGLYMTDLTGSLANFNIYAAIGRVEVHSEKYFNYDRKEKPKFTVSSQQQLSPISTLTSKIITLSTTMETETVNI